MKRARAFGLVGALVCASALAGCGGEESDPSCTGASCGGGGAGGMGGSGGASGLGGQGGTSGMGGSGGMSGSGGTGGTIMEPPIMGPAPTACVPSLAAAGGVQPTMLYAGGEQLKGLALRRNDLFASDGQGIMRLPEGATALERVTTANVTEVLAADLRLYWADAGSLYRVDFDAMAGAPELVASGLQAPATLLQHDEDNVFYANTGSSSVWRQPLDGTAGVQLVMGAAVSDLAIAGGSLYFAVGQAVKRVATDTGAATDVLTDAPRSVTAIDTNGVDLVWTDGVEIFGTEVENAQMHRPLSQAGPSASGAGQSRIKQIVLHDNAVYFVDNAGNVGKALLNGSLCELMLDGLGTVRAIAVSDEYLYLNKQDGSGSELLRIDL